MKANVTGGGPTKEKAQKIQMTARGRKAKLANCKNKTVGLRSKGLNVMSTT